MRKWAGFIGAVIKLVLVAITALGLGVGSALKAGANVGAKSPREKWADFTDKADPKMARIQDDLGKVSDAASEAQPGLEDSLRRLRCLTLEEHITADYKVLTNSPDKKLNNLTKSGLSAWRDGAKACKQGNFAKAMALVTRGTDYIDRAADRKQLVNAKYFPTAPTSVPRATTPPPTIAPAIQTNLPPGRILAGCAQAHAAYATSQQRPLTSNDVLQVTLGFVPTFQDSQVAGALLPVLSGLAFANQPQWVPTLQKLDAWCTSRGV